MFKKIVLPLILLAGGGFVVVLVVSSVFVFTGPGVRVVNHSKAQFNDALIESYKGICQSRHFRAL